MPAAGGRGPPTAVVTLRTPAPPEPGAVLVIDRPRHGLFELAPPVATLAPPLVEAPPVLWAPPVVVAPPRVGAVPFVPVVVLVVPAPAVGGGLAMPVVVLPAVGLTVGVVPVIAFVPLMVLGAVELAELVEPVDGTAIDTLFVPLMLGSPLLPGMGTP